MMVSLAMVASAAVGKNAKASAAQYQYKVTICHRTHSKKKPFHTITVAAAAVPAHLRHGDTIGPCETSEHSASATTSATKGKAKGKQKQSQTSTTSTTTTSHGSGAGNGNAGGNGNGNAKGKSK